MIQCIYCLKEFSNTGGKATHQPYCKSNPSRVTRYKSPDAHAPKGTPAWNKGVIGSTTGKGATPEKELERKNKISEKAKLSNGGYRQGSGRGKKGWYKDFFCDSSWELAYVIYCLENNISIVRNTQKYQYMWQDKIRNFIPDFIVDGRLTEVKGYKSLQWEAKMQATPDIDVLYGNDMKPIIRYVVDKYGKDYIRLYEEDRLHGADTVLKTVPLSDR